MVRARAGPGEPVPGFSHRGPGLGPTVFLRCPGRRLLLQAARAAAGGDLRAQAAAAVGWQRDVRIEVRGRAVHGMVGRGGRRTSIGGGSGLGRG